ncbi:PRD domain-containing protein [Enterococcus saccharolyticus]|nr:PRD domain-containing protein [Enterococcus saccharolyticus]
MDNHQRELIAFGKGVGFPEMPYEVDLEKITMTFYQVDTKYYDLIARIPEEIFAIASHLVEEAFTRLKGELNPNLVFHLADHIHFALVRQQSYQKIKLPFSFEIEQFYPTETQLGQLALELIKNKLHVTLPESEVTAIAWHFINARNESDPLNEEQQVENLIRKIVTTVETKLAITIDENSINYNRFVLHLRYYLKRLRENDSTKHEPNTFLDGMKKEFPEIYACAITVGHLVEATYHVKTSEEELLYLLIHINRIYQHAILEKTTEEDE